MTDDLAHRATHIDVDEGCAIILQPLRSSGHVVETTAEDLHVERLVVIAGGEQVEGLARLFDDRPCVDEVGGAHADAADLADRSSVRVVRIPGQGRECEP